MFICSPLIKRWMLPAVLEASFFHSVLLLCLICFQQITEKLATSSLSFKSSNAACYSLQGEDKDATTLFRLLPLRLKLGTAALTALAALSRWNGSINGVFLQDPCNGVMCCKHCSSAMGLFSFPNPRFPSNFEGEVLEPAVYSIFILSTNEQHCVL